MTGRVARKAVSGGSKSERNAIVLIDAGGKYLILRRRGGHPFVDEVLDGLVGKDITLTGTVFDGLVLMDEWREADGPEK
jgi:hypothetical protein